MPVYTIQEVKAFTVKILTPYTSTKSLLFFIGGGGVASPPSESISLVFESNSGSESQGPSPPLENNALKIRIRNDQF